MLPRGTLVNYGEDGGNLNDKQPEEKSQISKVIGGDGDISSIMIEPMQHLEDDDEDEQPQQAQLK
jgi:hypothetical protein